MEILVLNAGSSSEKCALFGIEPDASADPVAPLWEAKLEWNGRNESLTIRNCNGKIIRGNSEIRAEGHQARVEQMLQNLWSGPTVVLNTPAEITAVGHRIVHGGPRLAEPVVVTMEVKQAISDVAAIAPLHNQAGLQGIELVERLLSATRQIAGDGGFSWRRRCPGFHRGDRRKLTRGSVRHV
jgi:acetate kinase